MKTILIVVALLIAAEACNGVMDALQFHYPQTGFEPDSRFWNPAISWQNKYKGGDPDNGPAFFLSTTALVFLTDGWHLFKFLYLAFIRAAFVVLLAQLFPVRFTGNFKFLFWTGVWGVLSWVQAAGFHLTYSLIFN